MSDENLQVLGEMFKSIATSKSSKNLLRNKIQNDNLSKKEALMKLAQRLRKEDELKLNKFYLQKHIEATDRQRVKDEVKSAL